MFYEDVCKGSRLLWWHVGFTHILHEGTFMGMVDGGLLLSSCWVDESRGLLKVA